MSTVHAPSDFEQLMLELTNQLRTDPGGEFDRYFQNGVAVQSNIGNAVRYFGVDLTALETQLDALQAVAPLAWNGNLATAADTHSQLMIDFDQQSHNLPGEPSLGDRITDAGYTSWSRVGENIYAFTDDPLHGHAGFIIDWGYDDEDIVNGSIRSDFADHGDGIQDPPGHRNSLMNAAFTEIGIGALDDSADDASDDVGPYSVTQNLGNRFNYTPQLLGVVIDDADGDDFYDIGEGLGGITVTAVGSAGTFSTTTWASGGYQLELAAGSYSVTFSGDGFDTVTRQNVSIGGENVKVDAELTTATNAPATLEDPFFIAAPWLGPDATGVYGEAGVGQTVQVAGVEAFSDPTGLQSGSETWRWLRDGVHIEGATSSSYTFVHADVGTDITVELTFLDGAGELESYSPVAISNVIPINITGTSGDDIIAGNYLDNSIWGRKGNDIIRGGLGSDTYNVLINDGVDIIEDTGGTNDVLQVEYITEIYRKAEPGSTWEGTLVLELLGNDRVEVKNQFASHGRHLIETLTYTADGPFWSAQFTFNMHTGSTGGAGRDLLVGRSVTDFLKGNEDRDILLGGGSDDVLRGHAGNDDLAGEDGDDLNVGGQGADTYMFFSGDDHDTIIEYDGATDLASTDRLRLEDVTSLADIDIARGTSSGSTWEGHLVLETSATDSVTILNHFASNGRYVVEELVLAGGDTFKMTKETFGGSDADLLVGRSVVDYLKGNGGDDYMLAGANDDVIFGHAGADVLIGELGDDHLRGGDGADRYVVNAGDGDDLITEYDGVTDTTSVDVLVFKDIININDLTMSRVAEAGATWQGSLLIETATDSVRIQHHFASNDRYKVEQIELGDGSVYNVDDFVIV
ncbi:MAG: calcium-binding protein [Pseudomonadota bacterium]